MLSNFMTQRCFLIVYPLVDHKETSLAFQPGKYMRQLRLKLWRHKAAYLSDVLF